MWKQILNLLTHYLFFFHMCRAPYITAGDFLVTPSAMLHADASGLQSESLCECIIHPPDSFRNKTPLLCVFIGSKEHFLFGQFSLSILVFCTIVHHHPLQGSNVLLFSYQSSTSTTTSLHHLHFQRSPWQLINETNQSFCTWVIQNIRFKMKHTVEL